MVISVLGVCGLRILWIYTIFQIPAFHTPQCLYVIYPITWVTTTIAELILLKVTLKKRIAALNAQEAPLPITD